MKYFTKAWHRGELPDSEVARLQKSYRDYIEQNKESFPVDLRILATEVSIHDGLLTEVNVNQANNTLKMSLIIGDHQAGYEDLHLVYSGVDFARLGIDRLKILANSDNTELLYDEIEDIGNDNYEHRVSFWPDGELKIQFNTIEITRYPRKDRKRIFNSAIFQTNT